MPTSYNLHPSAPLTFSKMSARLVQGSAVQDLFFTFFPNVFLGQNYDIFHCLFYPTFFTFIGVATPNNRLHDVETGSICLKTQNT